MLDLVLDLFVFSTKELATLRFNKHNSHERLLASLYATILEQSEALLHLCQQGKDAGTGAILRSILEAFADLKVLLADPTHEKNLHFKFYHQWIKLLKHGLIYDKSFIDGVGGEELVAEKLAEWTSELDRLKAEGYTALTHEATFTKADMSMEYRTLYNMLCAESHNNLRVIFDRHLEPTEDGTDFHIVAFVPVKPEAFTATLFTLAGILRLSGSAIHERFKSGRGEEFDRFGQRIDELRETLNAARS